MIVNSAILSYKYIDFYFLSNNLADLHHLSCDTDCDAVMMSENAMIFGIPVPIYGFLMFLLIAVLFYRVFRDDDNQVSKKLLEICLLGSVLGALGFIYILYFKLELMCKFCMLSHVTLFLFTGYYFINFKARLNKPNLEDS